MQNADIYTEVNKTTAKYKDINKFLENNGVWLEWKPEEVILDVGCGPGDVTINVLQQWLPNDFRFLLGIDISDKIITHAQAVNANEKVEFKTVDIGGDISEILQHDKCSEGFDKMFSFYTLHWIQDLEKGIKNVFTLLKPGGQALVTFPADRPFQRTFKQVREMKQWNAYFKNLERLLPPFPRTADPVKEFSKLLESSGFEVQTCQIKDCRSHFDSLEKVKGLLESLDQDIGHIPPALRLEYLNDCVQAMAGMNALDINTNTVLQHMLTCVFKKPT